MSNTNETTRIDMIETLASIWITADRSITKDWIEKSQMAKVADVYDVATENGWSLTFWELRDLTASVVDRVMRHYYRTLCQEEAPANAALIADAPALLEALEWALDQIEDDLDPDHQEALVAARSLVAKHQGRG